MKTMMRLTQALVGRQHSPLQSEWRGHIGTVAIVLSLLLYIGIGLTNADAAGRRRSHDVTTVTFRLHVVGHPSPNTTFWVAYGPLDGHFGVIQLHTRSGGDLVAQEQLPTRGRTVFAYLAGHGVMVTPMGNVPGDPVVTIRRLGPTTAPEVIRTIVEYLAP